MFLDHTMVSSQNFKADPVTIVTLYGFKLQYQLQRAKMQQWRFSEDRIFHPAHQPMDQTPTGGLNPFPVIIGLSDPIFPQLVMFRVHRLLWIHWLQLPEQRQASFYWMLHCCTSSEDDLPWACISCIESNNLQRAQMLRIPRLHATWGTNMKL